MNEYMQGIKEFFAVKPLELALFIVCGMVYVGLQLWWGVMVAVNPGGMFPFLAGMSITAANNMVMLIFCIVLSLAYPGAAMAIIKDDPHEPISMFLMRFGVALGVYSSVAQIAAVMVPAARWTQPTEGIPVMRTLTIAVSAGIVLAGIGANMVWMGERREEFLAATSKKKR